LTLSTVRQNLAKFDYTGLGLPALVLLIMAMLVVPLPALLLDILFTFNIACSLLIIMIAIGTRKPLEFSSFPSVLLFATMLRLGLNVASTRVILVSGHEGHEAAGKVVAAFGEFVIGGNYVVGFIIFAILMIINFIVVTKGAGRVSEVNARFTLDAMPGKQMSIDADLNAGVIDQDTAKKRREELSQESDFFGSMDGASKFVSGDAVAGLLILVINLIGGLAIGVGQHNLSLGRCRAHLHLVDHWRRLGRADPLFVLVTGHSHHRHTRHDLRVHDRAGHHTVGQPHSFVHVSGHLGHFGLGARHAAPGLLDFGFGLCRIGLAHHAKTRCTGEHAS
jgi:flagellar biosynthesis component FlhA